MSADFSHLARLQATEASTSLYRLFQLEGEPTLTVSPAAEVNAPYLNELLKQSKESSRRLQASGVTREALEQRRDDARALFSKHVVKGWSGVVDSKGAPVEFSQEACLAFLRALPGWIFDALQAFCTNQANFVKPGMATAKDTEALAGN